MTFQQHTTYEQSVRLKELGLEQCTPESDHLGFRKVYWSKTVDGYDTVRFSPIGPTRLIGTFKDYVRAITRQEIEDVLMEHYLLCIDQDVSDDGGRSITSIWLYDTRRPVFDRDPDGQLYADQCEGLDPFTAIYDALVWHLEQQRKAPTTTPEAPDTPHFTDNEV